MAEKFYGLIPQEEWLDVGFQVNRPNDPLDGLVGDLRTNNIIASEMMEHLEMALDSASDQDRETIKRFMRQLENA